MEENTYGGFFAEKRKGRFTYFDVESGRAIKTHENSASWVIYRELSPDGSHAAIASWIRNPGDLRVRTIIQDQLTGQEREVLLRYPTKDHIVVYGGSFAPTEKWYAVSGNVEEPLRVIELATGKTVCAMGKWNVAAQGFSADGKLIAVSCMSEGKNQTSNHPFDLLELPSGKQVIRIPTETRISMPWLCHTTANS